MARVLIFTFDNGDDTYTNVYADTIDPTDIVISRPFNYLPGQDHFPTYHNGDPAGTPTCQGTTQTYYTYIDVAPNAEYHQVINSPYCGFTPPVCDLTLSTINHTDETSTGANDGTVNVFFTSSHLPIVYDLVGAALLTNTVGYFTGVSPGTYHVETRDALGCTASTGNITVQPFDSSLTRCKYRLRFSTIKTGIAYELRFLYQKSQFDPLVYPLDLTGTDVPIKKRGANANEDKTEAFAPSSLSINVIYNEVFDVAEFRDAQERDWKIELYKNGVIDWQGWLLPDQLQDLYADPLYPIELIATDGILSLKGGTFADQTLSYLTPDGIKRYVQLFGLKKWIYLVKICLDQLGYDYGNVTILSSLSYQEYKGSLLWLNLSTWSDLFYDQNNEPKSTYDALEILLKGVKLQLFQDNGKFYLVDNNDLYWRNITDLQPYCFLTDLDTFVNNSAALPANRPLGANQINKPINPQQTFNYDNAFSRIAGNIDFNLLSLLYPNPSFEFNAIEGNVPYLLTEDAGMDAFSHYLPQDPLDPNIGAYSGDWVMRTIGQTLLLKSGGFLVSQANGSIFFERNAYNWVHPLDDFIIDQGNKKLNISFVWKPLHYSDDENVMPRLYIYYIDDNTSTMWTYSLTDKGGFNGTGWFQPDHAYAFTLPAGRVTDYQAWNQVNITTDKFPENGLGHVAIGIGTPVPFGTLTDMSVDRQIDYDALVITQSDGDDVYNFQKGETHTVTNVTTYAKSEKKDIGLELYTYPTNKRVSGNVAYGDNYLTSLITNEWYFGLSVEQVGDRLPANIIRRFAKNYQRPMYKWQGDVFTDEANYYSVWIIRGYENKVFTAFTIDHDLRNSIANLVLIEVDDTQMQSIYQYLRIYEKSARNNLS